MEIPPFQVLFQYEVTMFEYFTCIQDIVLSILLNCTFSVFWFTTISPFKTALTFCLLSITGDMSCIMVAMEFHILVRLDLLYI